MQDRYISCLQQIDFIYTILVCTKKNSTISVILLLHDINFLLTHLIAFAIDNANILAYYMFASASSLIYQSWKYVWMFVNSWIKISWSYSFNSNTFRWFKHFFKMHILPWHRFEGFLVSSSPTNSHCDSCEIKNITAKFT